MRAKKNWKLLHEGDGWVIYERPRSFYGVFKVKGGAFYRVDKLAPPQERPSGYNFARELAEWKERHRAEFVADCLRDKRNMRLVGGKA